MAEWREILPGVHLARSGSNKVWPGEVERLAHRQVTRVCVLSAEKYDQGFPEMEGLLDYVEWLNGIIEGIPAEYRRIARMDRDSVTSFDGSHYPSIEITYDRPETDEEWEARKADVQKRIDQQNAQERAAYEALKAKYG